MPTQNPDYNTNKKYIKKEVSYLGKDFPTLRQNLIEFAKTYFPNTYNDFNESSPGMMFIEMAAYVGDVLNYYIDNQFRETLLLQAEEKKNIFDIAQTMGYKPSLSSPASVELSVTIDVPSKAVGDDYQADLSYAGVLKANSIVSSDSGVQFTILDDVNFKVSSSLDQMKVELLEPTSGTSPTNFRLTKKVLAKSGTRVSEDFSFTSAKKFDSVVLSNEKVNEIISVTDSNSNEWYQVPYLAQDTIYESIENTTTNDPELGQYQNDTPYLLKLIKTAKRYATYIRDDNKIELRFGTGVSTNADEEIIPNPDNVGSSLSTGISKLDDTFDPTNFLKTKTFGLAPSNTTLTIKYSYGGSVDDNVPSNTITNLDDVTFTINSEGLDTDKVNEVDSSLSVTNIEPASGGSDEETIDEVRQNSLAYFNAQGRAVTMNDYIGRVYSLPQKYGNIGKAYIVQDEQLEQLTQTQIVDGQVTQVKNNNTIPNPLALNLYVLGFDANKKLTRLNRAVKENLKTYLSQYRLVTDSINIKDAYIINISVKFAIITRRGYNKNEVLLRCVDSVKKYFDPQKRQINQPIVLSDIAYVISLQEGVASIVPPRDDNPNKQIVLIENKYKTADGYSGNVFDTQTATRDGVVYPSLDPSIFEIKYPNIDIEGRVVGDF